MGKIYPLTLKEQKATEDFLEENLQLGRIHPSNSPQAASFFFVDKKDASDTLRPCQDYRYVNTHTIKDTYPLQLVQNLIDQVKDTKVFTKFDVRWGYNNIHIWCARGSSLDSDTVGSDVARGKTQRCGSAIKDND